MAVEPHDNTAPDTEAKEAAEPTAEAPAVVEDIESRITNAMFSRVAYFKEQANSLTFEGVRRVLEKDLGLETLALDVHKRFVKECLLTYLNDGNASKSSGETLEKNESTTTDVTESPKGRQSKKDMKEACSEDEEKLEDSPVLGLLTGNETTKKETTETEKKENNEVSESMIKKAIRKRAAYIEANSDTVTLAGLRRLLEEDLNLDKFTLDPYKKFISEQLDEVLKSPKVSAPASDFKKQNLKKHAQSKAPKRASKKVGSASSGSESDEEEEDEDKEEDEEEEEEEVKPKKKIPSKGKIKNSEGLNKRRRPNKEAEILSKKRSKHAASSDDNSDSKEIGSVSDDGHSRSSAAKAVKRKETSTPVYGKHVEHLKSVIKSCGMSVPPSIYKRVKQVPENKREAQLIKQLEEILSKEGLSSNPSEKEIKEVRKRKERAKELEGIDTSNIVSSSRRRSTNSFVAPPKPKIPDLSDGDESEESDEDNDEDEDNDDEDEDNDDEDGGDEGNSQSEESDEEEDEDSD